MRWCTESNRPLNIVNDHEFEVLMKAGRPGTTLPSVSTAGRDVKAVFERCRERIDNLLKVSATGIMTLVANSTEKEHSGCLHFATDTWTSPNHRAFVAWTVHLHHQGHLLSFLLDIIEVPEVGSQYHLLGCMCADS